MGGTPSRQRHDGPGGYPAPALTVTASPARSRIPNGLSGTDYVDVLSRPGGHTRRVVAGKIAGRAHREEITLFASVGLATQDLAIGAMFLAACRPPWTHADDATAAHDEDRIAVANGGLHEVIVATTGNALLADLMRPVSGRTRWLFRLTADRDPVEQQHEHHELCAAILAGDVELAGALAYAHIERGREPSLASLRGVLPAG